MIRVHLSFVPPGGGETDYGLMMDMPALPRAGDYISVMREGAAQEDEERRGFEDFLVRRVWWTCSYPDDGKFSHQVGSEPVGTCEVNVECEFAIGAFSSIAHKISAMNYYENRGKSEPHRFEETNY